MKNKWRKNWLTCLNELTSLALQKESWLDKSNSNPHWSYIEFMNCYFDDLGLDENYKDHLAKGFISQGEFEIIEEWHEALDKYDSPNSDDYDHETILNDNKWLDILVLGMIAKNRLAEMLNDNEKKMLVKKIDYFK